jgi:Putative zinc-finger
VPHHPDSEQLAAFQAGDGDRRQRAEVEAHLAGCPACAEAVAAVDRARDQLALLQEPELPAGLHDRLAAAVDAEVAAGGIADGARSRRRRPFSPATGGRPTLRHGRAGSDQAGDRAAPVPGRSGGDANGEPSAGRVGAGQRRGRPAPWYRRPVAWGAAAALLLAALVAVPLLDQSSDMTTAGGAGGGQAAREAADTGATAAVPLLRIPGEVSAATVRSRLTTDRQAKAALDSANARRAAGAATGAAPGGETAVPQAQDPAAPSQSLTSPGAPSQSTTTPAAPSGDLSRSPSRSTARSPATAPAALAPCLTAATAAADPAALPLTPAFFVEGTYRGRQAIILVTTSGGQPARVDLWAFPRDDCSSPPLDTERVR